MKNEENERAFYTRCADLLGTECDYRHFPYTHKTRWNNRDAGNGRFPGHGLIRYHSDSLVIIQLYAPRLSGRYTAEEAIEALVNVLELGNST